MSETHPASVRTLPGPVAELRQWNVVLINDEEHSYNYVTRLLGELFHMPADKAVELATAIDRNGRAVCFTAHREYAEFKREQIVSFGRDALVERSTGSMCALVEAAA